MAAPMPPRPLAQVVAEITAALAIIDVEMSPEAYAEMKTHNPSKPLYAAYCREKTRGYDLIEERGEQWLRECVALLSVPSSLLKGGGR
jgi:hypothetical protein